MIAELEASLSYTGNAVNFSNDQGLFGQADIHSHIPLLIYFNE